MKSNPSKIMSSHGAMRSLLTVMIILAFLFSVQAQVDDSGSDYQRDFENFSKDIVREYDGFRKTNDSIFLRYLEESWTELTGRTNKIPVTPKPAIQPAYESIPEKEDMRDLKLENVDQEDPDQKEFELNDHDQKHLDQKDENLNDSTSAHLNRIPEPDALLNDQNITFYGSTINLPPFNTSMPLLEGLSKEAASNFYLQASISDQFKELLAQVRMKALRHRLNDWGYTSLLMKVAGFYYTDNNNRNAFLWAALLMSGLNVKLGLNSKGAYLLVPADVMLYGVSYTIGQKEYYPIGPTTPSAGEKLSVHQADYPGNRHDFIISIHKAPLFEDDPVLVQINSDKTLALTINKNLIEYYQNYPPCDLKVPFNAPLTESVIKQLDRLLLHLLEGKDDDARTAMLLRFVQRAFRYKNDDLQFGKEKYQFAEELLFNGAGDCEDRAALFAVLLNRYTKHDIIGLRYPDHISVAVNLTECKSQDVIRYNGRSFYHCDPTYLGAECGRAMPAVSEQNPEIINLQNHEITNL